LCFYQGQNFGSQSDRGVSLCRWPDDPFTSPNYDSAAWQYGIFANYRNVLWSCNWNPVKNFEWTTLGVKTFGDPVAISNGWGESKGISQYSEQEIQKVYATLPARKGQRSRVWWTTVVDN